MHHESEWGPRPERECGDEVHILGKKVEPVWPFLDGLAVYYKKRFEKNRDKLFTFLDYDGIPWNNNNAEHAIKAFARLRRGIGGTSTEKGIREYLTLLSICETCKYKGVSFLQFLRSGEKDIDAFIKKGARVSKQSGFLNRLPE
jgi:Transposase IS66 family